MIPVLGLVILVATFTSCEREDEAGEEETAVPVAQTVKTPAWADALGAYLPALGHRNWIVVADSAFPLQISPGIETIVSNEDHFTVLDKVLKVVDGAKHIRPKIWLDKELSFVTEALAPGADDARLGQVGKTFKIVMIKTTLAVPYTSVFLELDCGYWGPEAEAKMREKMK
jgi:hypothetical protein